MNVIGKLNQHANNSAIKCQIVLDHILKYLKKTANFIIIYIFNNVVSPVSFENAEYSDNIINCKLTYHRTTLLDNNIVV